MAPHYLMGFIQCLPDILATASLSIILRKLSQIDQRQPFPLPALVCPLLQYIKAGVQLVPLYTNVHQSSFIHLQ